MWQRLKRLYNTYFPKPRITQSEVIYMRSVDKPEGYIIGGNFAIDSGLEQETRYVL